MKKFLNTVIALLLVLSFSSCLKDKELIGPDADGAIANVIEFGNLSIPVSGVSSPYPVYIHSLELKPGLKLEVPIKIVGVFNPKQDISVTVELDNSILPTYNASQKGTYVPVPPANFSIDNYTVVIPKGSRTAYLSITLNGDKFDFNANYALPLRIKTISEGVISGNFGSIILATVPKNDYDGIYSVEDGNMQRYSGPGSPTTNDPLNGSMKGNPNVIISSINATTSKLDNLKWANNQGGIGGIDNLSLTVDPITNLVKVFAGGNPTLANIPGKVNKYDPATKTFTLNFDWNQTSTKREVTNLVLKYVSPRP